MVSICILTLRPKPELEEMLKKQTYQSFEIVYATEKGIVNAMNIALDKAKGDILVRIDDDVWLPPTWLAQIVEPFDDPFVAGVTGPTYVPLIHRNNRDSIRIAQRPNRFLRWMFDNNPYAVAKIYKCGSVSYGSNFYFGDFVDGYSECDHLEGTNWAMRTALIRKVGGFDSAFDGVAEWYDTDVEYKVRELCMGHKFIYNSAAYVCHMLQKGSHYDERFNGWSRIKNWLRFHYRHSDFHPKMAIWFIMMIGYYTWKKFQS